MTPWWDVNLLHLFGFYLALMFLVGLYRRTAQYRAIGGLVVAGPGRWPRLMELVSRHGMVFMTWATFLPALMALGLTIIHMLASRLIWPQANLMLSTVADLWISWPFIFLTGAAMLGIDLYGVIAVAKVDQQEMEKYFDEAEYWLRSWTAPVVQIVTLGRINPRQMVNVEVQKALVEASKLINTSLWWVTAQIGARVAFGLTLWLTYAIGV